MFGKLVCFIIGTYAGIFIDQHYQIPKVDDPQALWTKIKEFAENYKKKD